MIRPLRTCSLSAIKLILGPSPALLPVIGAYLGAASGASAGQGRSAGQERRGTMPKRSSRRLLLAAVAGALLPWAAGAVAQSIKIGGIAPLSPPGGVQTGESLRDGMRVAVEELNAGGGLLGREVELIVEDTSGVPEKGVAAFERLATREDVVAVTGSAHSAVCAAVGPIAHKHGIPFVAGECWADNVTAAQIPEVFRITVANSLIYSVSTDWVKEAGFKHVAIIGENSDWGLGVIDIFKSG